jgi:hypothetical protein
VELTSLKEEILHFYWISNVKKGSVFTGSKNEEIEIVNPGVLNTNQGPDFLNSTVIINGIKLFGNVEMHLSSKDWYGHNHHKDPNYNNVILHVVKDSNCDVFINNQVVCELNIASKLSFESVNYISNFIKNSKQLPCKSSWSEIDNIIKISFLDRMFFERMESKCSDLKILYENYNGDVAEVFHNMVFKYFGGSVNRIAFERLGEILSYKIILKAIQGSLPISELFNAVSGIESPSKDVKHFIKKHNLETLPLSIWHKHRMFPSSSAPVRLEQLSYLVSNLYPVSVSEFNLTWLGKNNSLSKGLKGFSKNLELNSMIPKSFLYYLDINVYLPLVYFRSELTDDFDLKQICIDYYFELPFENNKVTRKFKTLIGEKTSAADSQALIHLFKDGCSNKKCLYCSLSGIKFRSEKVTKSFTVF